MPQTKWSAGFAVAAVTGLLVSGCATEHSISSAGGDDPNWQVSIEQTTDSGMSAPKIPRDVVDRLSKTAPQFKSPRYWAIMLPLGQKVENGEKVTRFALSANLPQNCFTPSTPKPASKGDCVDFIYAATNQKADSGKSEPDVKIASNVVELTSTKGISLLEMTSPEDAEALVVGFHTEGKTVRIDPVTGKVLSEARATYIPHGR